MCCLSKREWYAIIRAEDDKSIFLMTSLLKFLKNKSYPLIQPGDSCVLSSYILPSCWGIRKIRRDYHIFWLVENWSPVRNCPHTWFTITIPLTKVPILWLGMTTSVRVMKCNIEEERRVLGDHRGEECPDQVLDMSDVPTYTVYSIILLSLGKLKRINLFWPNMLLANNTSGYVVLH